MKVALALLTLTTLLAVGTYLYTENQTPTIKEVEINSEIPTHIKEAFYKWKSNFNIQHMFGEDPHRMTIFHENFKTIEAHNAKEDKTYEMGLNQFSALTNAEFRSQYNTLQEGQISDKENEMILLEESSTPSSVDWRKKGAVTPVKDQGQCGSCWSFSTTGSLEGLSFISGKGLQSFSEQQLCDCSKWWYWNMGCNGGLMTRAFKYVKANGIALESSYPYEAKDQSCKTKDGVFKIKSYVNVGATDAQMAAAVAQQPVSVGLDASNWQHYKSGVFSDCGEQMDHGVLVVGYTPDAWIIKNSWNTVWGEKGYIRIKRGNTCGVLNTASYPTL